MEAARKRSHEGGAERFAVQLESLTADLSLVQDLDAVNQFRWTWVDGAYPEQAEVATRTRAALARFGADLDAASIDQISFQVSESAVKERIIAAMPPKYVMWDNDVKFSGRFDDKFTNSGIQIKRTVRMSPNLRAHVEKFIQTLEFECLSKFVIVPEKQLDQI